MAEDNKCEPGQDVIITELDEEKLPATTLMAGKQVGDVIDVPVITIEGLRKLAHRIEAPKPSLKDPETGTQPLTDLPRVPIFLGDSPWERMQARRRADGIEALDEYDRLFRIDFAKLEEKLLKQVIKSDPSEVFVSAVWTITKPKWIMRLQKQFKTWLVR